MALCAGTLLSTAVAIPAVAAAAPAPSVDADLATPSTALDRVGAEAAAAPSRSSLSPAVAAKAAAAPSVRYARLDAEAVADAAAAGRFTLELTDGVAVTVHGDGAPVPGAGDTTTWSGTTPDGYATFTFAGDQVFGDVTVAGTRYDVAPTGTGSTHLVTVEQRAFPPEDPPRMPPPAAEGLGDGSAGPAASSPSATPVVRLLTVFATDAAAYWGGNANAIAEISATINEMNAAYARSGIDQVVESVGIEPVAYTSSGSSGTDLDRVTDPADGSLDAVHTRRNETYADVVHLITDLTTSCGQAYVLGTTVSHAPYAFGVTGASCARANLSMVHEIGHNMGGGHGNGDGAGIFAYSNGFRNTAHGFRTIMAYDSTSFCCPRVAHFSSPTVLYNGWATGTVNADNARTINETAPITAQYRGDPPFSPPGAPTAVSAVAGNTQATVSWTAPGNPGGGPILDYTVTSSPGSKTCTATATSCTVTGLVNGTSYTFTVKARNAGGQGPASAASNAVVPSGPPPVGSDYHPVNPVRVQDSRPASKVGPYASPWAAGTTRSVQVAGVAGSGVPADAVAVVVNLTVTGATADSFLSVWPSGTSMPSPLVSSINWVAGDTIANNATVKVGTGGAINVYNASGAVHVIVDVVGWYGPADGDGYTALVPKRVLDTRPSSQVGPYGTPWPAGTTRDITVAGGTTGVPADADGVVLNVTITGPTAASFLSVWPTGQATPSPLVSSINWTPGQTIPNGVTAKVGTAGQIRLFNASGTVHVIVDVVGYFRPGTGKQFYAVDPSRVLDARPAPFTVGPFTTPWNAGTTRDVTIAGVAGSGVPATATAVVTNVTVTGATAGSHLSLWPTGQAQPDPPVSTLNWPAGRTIANGTTATTGTTGRTRVFNNSGNVYVIVDVSGYFA
ncbi:MAG: fibronectin type III domain-containing protein [Acidimicrobiales bacterium]